MFEIIKAGGLLMVPILICSVLVLAIVIERYWTLRSENILPASLLPKVWLWIKQNELDIDKIKQLRQSTLLGQVLAAGLSVSKHGRDAMKDAIQETGSHVAHEMERFLNVLAVVANIAPLLGLLGTVIGMIDVFTVIMQQGAGNASLLAGGISKALITTAAGLTVAIPALIFHKSLSRRVDSLLVEMERTSTKLVEALHSEQSVSSASQS